MFRVLPFNESYWNEVWSLLEPVFRAGDTYGVSTDITKTDAYRMWIELPAATFVTLGVKNEVLGTFYIKPNVAGPGSHVCNCGYVVADAARGQGIASMMCEFSQNEARQMGFTAMQFNFVASTNVGAVGLWQKHGFEIVGTLPAAFQHPAQGFVDAYVMFKDLRD